MEGGESLVVMVLEEKIHRNQNERSEEERVEEQIKLSDWNLGLAKHIWGFLFTKYVVTIQIACRWPKNKGRNGL